MNKKKNKESDYKNQLARALADYDNLQKRVERERGGLEYRIKSQILTRILPSIDLLYGANSHLKDQGLAMAISELEDTLKEEGVVKINAQEGELFDESLHEVIDVVENQKRKGRIAAVVSNGWQMANGSPA